MKFGSLRMLWMKPSLVPTSSPIIGGNGIHSRDQVIFNDLEVSLRFVKLELVILESKFRI
jgi:hypothetical protein